jgi:hypothetical protein
MQPDKVLVGTILHETKAYSFGHLFAWFSRLTYPNKEFAIRVHTGPYGEPHAVKRYRERIRQQAVDEDFDYLLMVDCDTIGPDDMIEQLMAAKAELATGIYFGRTMDASNRAVAWKTGDPEQAFLKHDDVSDISGAGMGACLISGTALYAVDFNHAIPDDDYPYWEACKSLGFRCVSVNKCLCRHYYSAEGYHWLPEMLQNDPSLFDYNVCCPDGVNVNGIKFASGLHKLSHELWEEISRLDEPYRTKKVDATRSTLKGLRALPDHLSNLGRQSVAWGQDSALVKVPSEAKRVPTFSWENAGVDQQTVSTIKGEL